MDLESALVGWMDEHEADMFDLLREEEGRFLALHPGLDAAEARVHATAMANRRFIARALGAVLPEFLRGVRE